MGVSPNHAFYFRIFHEINQAFWSSSISGFTTKKRGFHKWGYSTPIAGWFNGESIYRWMKNGVPLWLRKPPYKYNSIHIILYIEYIYTIYIYILYIYTHTYCIYLEEVHSKNGWLLNARSEDTRQDVGWTSSCSSRSWIFQHGSSHLSSGCDLPLLAVD